MVTVLQEPVTHSTSTPTGSSTAPAFFGCSKGVKPPGLGKKSLLPPCPPPAPAKAGEGEVSWTFVTPAKPAPTRPKFNRPNADFRCVAAASRLAVQEFVRTQVNLPGGSVMLCMRGAAFGISNPETVEIRVDDGRAMFINCQPCKNVWTCAHCARARVAQMRGWLRGCFFPCLTQNGFTGGLLTLTLSHEYDSDWGSVVDRLEDTFRLFDRRMHRLYKKMGMIGKVKSLEVTIGKNGIHPHFHILLCYPKGKSNELDINVMRDCWARCVAEVGGKTNQHGFDWQPDRLDDYLAKLGSAFEMCAHGTKSALSKGRSLEQLLLQSQNNPVRGEEWVRAIRALAGRMRFHAGALPKKLGLPCPSDWREEPEDVEEDAALPSDELKTPPEIISYPRELHLKATSPSSPRAGLALIARAARCGGAVAVERMVMALIKDEERRRLERHSKYAEPALRAVIEKAKKSILKPDEIDVYLYAKRRGVLAADTATL